jgi:hypothetical protein
LAEPTDTPGIAAVPLSKLGKKAPKSVKAPLSAEAALENNTCMMGALMELIQKTMTKNAATFPIARTSKNQKFDSKNATTFIKRFEGLLKDYEPEADGDRKAELLERNVTNNLQSQVSNLDGFEGGNWELLHKNFLQEFMINDADCMIGTPAYLEKLCSHQRKKTDNLRQYYQLFVQSSTKIPLIELSSFSCTKLLLKGLPIQMATAIYCKTNIRIGEASTFDDFPNILKVAKAVINEKYEVGRLRDEDSGDDIDELVHTIAKDQPKFDPSQVARESSQATGPDMNQLANEFQKMVLSLMSKSNANLALKPTVEADFDDPSAGIYVTISPKLSGKC